MITPPLSVRNHLMSADGNTRKKLDPLAVRIRDGLDECTRRGLGRGEIATRMGHETASSLSKWARGRQRPDSDNIAALAQASGLSADWIMLGRGPMFADVTADDLATQLVVIGKVKDGEIPAETLRALATPQSEGPEDLDELLETSGEARTPNEGGDPEKKRVSGSETGKK